MTCCSLSQHFMGAQYKGVYWTPLKLRLLWLPVYICVYGKRFVSAFPGIFVPSHFLWAASLVCCEQQWLVEEMLVIDGPSKIKLWDTDWTWEVSALVSIALYLWEFSLNYGDASSVCPLVAHRQTAARVLNGRSCSCSALPGYKEHWRCQGEPCAANSSAGPRRTWGVRCRFPSRYASSMFTQRTASAAIKPASFGCPRLSFV